MKRITSILMSLLLAAGLMAQTMQLERVWEFSVKNENSAPDYIGATRSLVAGDFGGELSVIAVKAGAVDVIDLININPATGETIGTLNKTGIEGGHFVLCGATLSDDGKLFASNMISQWNAFDQLKVYRWDNATSAPVLAINYTRPEGQVPGYRFGDKISISGKVSDGTAKLYTYSFEALSDDNGGYNLGLVFSIKEGTTEFDPVPAVVKMYHTTGHQAQQNMTFLPDGRALFKATGEGIRLLSGFGGQAEEVHMNMDLFGAQTSSIDYVGTTGSKTFISAIKYSGDAGTTQGLLVGEVKNDDWTQSSQTQYIEFGTTGNGNGTGGTCAVKEGDDTFIYALATNNGIAKYKVNYITQPSNALVPVWEQTAFNGTWADYVTYGARSLVAGNFGGVDAVIVPNHGWGGPVFRMLNPANGEFVQLLSTTGIAGGALVASDCALSEDGKLFVANYIGSWDAGNNDFYIYMYDNKDSEPKKVISFTRPEVNYSLDRIRVTGKVADGSLKIYVPNGASLNNMLVFSMVPDIVGGFMFNQTPEILPASADGFGGTVGMDFLPNGKAVLKGNGGKLMFLKGFGGQEENALFDYTTTFPWSSAAPAFVTETTDAYYIGVMQFAPDSRMQVGKVMKNDLSDVTLFSSNILGFKENANGTGSICVVNESGDLYLYALSSENGLGKYKFPKITTGLEGTVTDNIRIITAGKTLFVEGTANPSMDIYSITGQKVMTSTTGIANVETLHGVHIVVVKENGKTVKTEKVIIK